MQIEEYYNNKSAINELIKSTGKGSDHEFLNNVLSYNLIKSIDGLNASTTNLNRWMIALIVVQILLIIAQILL
jgi:hypothetical protein